VITKSSYLNYARRILEHYETEFPNRVEREFFQQTQALGGFVGHLVNAWAQMHRITGDNQYAQRAKELLLYWSRYPAFNPPGEKAKLSVGPFVGCMLVGGLKVLRDNGFLTAEEEAPVWSCIYDMVNVLVDPYVKQGKEKVLERSHAWNHPTMDMTLAVETAQIFPEHPDASKWMEWGRLVLDQSFNKPTVEDATNYTPIWFLHTIRAAELLGLTEEFYAYPYTRYYFQYLRDLIMPTGQLPDFGDTSTFGDWTKTVAILEKAATVYRDGTYKTAAHRLFQFMAQYGPMFGGETNHTPTDDMMKFIEAQYQEMKAKGGWYASVADVNPYVPEKITLARAQCAVQEASFLLLAYQWADDDVPEAPIPARDVLYERRAILKNGWSQEDSYLLFGLEDWTRVHGHGEGNAINYFSKGSTILLHEGCYGHRQEIFHNTVVWKDGLSDKPFDYIWGKGYTFFIEPRPPERRAKVPIFEPMHNTAFLRSRLDQFQRTLVKAGEAVYVFDYLDIRGYYSAACLYHTEKIVEQAGNYYRTRIGNVFSSSYPGYFWNCENPGDGELLIVFPKAKATGVKKEIRAETDAYVVYQTLSENLLEGVAFSSILVPVRRTEPSIKIALKTDTLQTQSEGQGVYPKADGVKLTFNGETVHVCCKNVAGLGLVTYGDVESDADVLYLIVSSSGVQVSAVNASIIKFKGQTILDSKEKRGRFEDVSQTL